MRPFKETQHWLASAIRYPMSHQDEIGTMIQGGKGGGLSAEARLAIYGEAFYGRLHQVMQGEYPALRHAMEQDLFDHFVAEYLRAYPPSSYTLTDLGKKFPAYLRDTRPPDDEELWPEFIIELAQLERTFQEVFYGEGGEKTNKQQGKSFESIAQESFSVVLQCRFPVHEYFLAFRSGEELEYLPEPRSSKIIVYRRDYQVHLMCE